MRNTLYYGDNLEIMRNKLRDETVHLCYIDPPFNSKRNYNQIYNKIGSEDLAQEQAFVDTWSWDDQAREGYEQILSNHLGRFTAQTIELMKGFHAVLKEDSLLAYLISVVLRVAEVNRVLVETGSFYLHCDPNASHYLKLLVDSVFLPRGGNFQNEIIWKRGHGHNSARKFGPNHDVVLFYSKGLQPIWNKVFQAYDPSYLVKHYRHVDASGRRYKHENPTGAGIRNGETGKAWRGIDPTKKNRHWAKLPEELDRLDADGLIHWPSKAGAWPYIKVYLEGKEGIPAQDTWTDIDPINMVAKERIGFPTQKPMALLDRIIRASSNPGDLVLDAYCGCGTTVAVAQRLERRWIGIDITYQAIATILRRVEDDFDKDILKTINLDGLPRDMASARALAHKSDDRLRKEFEKWAILSYTDNRAIVRETKGADGGIDGVFYFWNGGELESAKMVLQAKSGGVQRKDIAALRGDMERQNAALACLITLEEPTKPMLQNAKAFGIYENRSRGIRCDRVRIVRIEDIIHGAARVELPLHPEATNKARRDAEGNQLSLDLKPPTSQQPGLSEQPQAKAKPPARVPGKKPTRSSRIA